MLGVGQPVDRADVLRRGCLGSREILNSQSQAQTVTGSESCLRPLIDIGVLVLSLDTTPWVTGPEFAFLLT